MTDTSYEVVAHNSATASENRIHDDEVAASFGFRGGLVPGVDVYAYLCRPVLDRWGERYLAAGRASTRFERPVFDGEVVRIEHQLDGDGVLRAEAVTAAGPCAWLRAELVDDPTAAEPAPAPGPVAPLPHPDQRPPASPETLVEGTALGTLEAGFTPDEAAAYLDEVVDPHSPVAELGLVHPGWLLRFANRVLSSTVLLGPWIHVGSEIRHLRPVAVGETMSVRGTVERLFERKGHRFVTLDATVVDSDGAVRWAATHTAIYQPRQVRTDL